MATQKKAGRPKATDKPDVVSLLVTSFHNGLNVREACLQAGISHEAYYNRLRSDEQFADTMAKAQMQPKMNAKVVVVKAIQNGDVGAAKWWLERKARDEFGRDAVTTDAQPNPVEINEAQIQTALEDRAKIDAWKARMKEYVALKQPLLDEIRRQSALEAT